MGPLSRAYRPPRPIRRGDLRRRASRHGGAKNRGSPPFGHRWSAHSGRILSLFTVIFSVPPLNVIDDDDHRDDRRIDRGQPLQDPALLLLREGSGAAHSPGEQVGTRPNRGQWGFQVVPQLAEATEGVPAV